MYFFGFGITVFYIFELWGYKATFDTFLSRKRTLPFLPGGYYPSSLSIIIIIDVYFEILAEGRQICVVGEEYVEVTQGRPFGFEVECVTIDGEPTQGLCSNLTFCLFNSLLLPRN